MLNTEFVWNILAPYDCLGCGAEGRLVCADCWPQLFNPTTLWPPANVAKYHTVTSYDGLAKALVHAMKVDCRRQASGLIARAMDETAPALPPDTIVTSVPTASARIRERGFDHGRLIATDFARRRGLAYQQLLVRHGRAKQAGTGRAARARQIKGAYQLRKVEYTNRPTVIIDDVMTTGVTLAAIVDEMARNNLKPIMALVFARHR